MPKSSETLVHLPRVETVRDWLLDSFHQHFDDVIKAGVLLLFVHGDEVAAVCVAAAAMLVSLFVLLFAHKMVRTHAAHKQARAPMHMQEAIFEAEFVTMLREYQSR